jgi:hypothetical protein
MIHLYTCITKIEYIVTKEPNQTRSLMLFSLSWGQKSVGMKRYIMNSKKALWYNVARFYKIIEFYMCLF